MKKYIRAKVWPLLAAGIFSLLASLFAVGVQFLKGSILDFALEKNISKSLSGGLLLGLFILMELGFFYLYDLSKGRFAVASIGRLREDYFSSLLGWSYPNFIKKSQASYVAQYTKEMEVVENQYFSTIPLLMEIVIKIAIVSAFLLILDWRVALLTLFLLSLPLYVPRLLEKRLQGAQLAYVKENENHLKEFSGWLAGFELIKNFSIEKRIKESFEMSNSRSLASNLAKRRLGYQARSLSALLSYSSHYLILVFSVYLVIRGDFSPGDSLVALGMIDQLSYPIISLSYLIQDLVGARPIAGGLIQLIEEGGEKREGVTLDPQDFFQLSFKKVHFGYGDEEELLKDLSFSFEREKTYLIEGKSGSGKTSSMELLLDYHSPGSGQVSINDIPVSRIKNLNELITIMRQDAVFFEDSLRNNMNLYQDREDGELIELLNKLGLKKFASKKGLDLRISEGGGNLSGGEKRRISLARALLRKTPILILDEPLANLDDKNARFLEELLLGIGDRTLIIISHQFSLGARARLDGVVHLS